MTIIKLNFIVGNGTVQSQRCTRGAPKRLYTLKPSRGDYIQEVNYGKTVQPSCKSDFIPLFLIFRRVLRHLCCSCGNLLLLYIRGSLLITDEFIQAFKKGFMEAHPVLLEPIASLKVTVPDAYTGDVMGDWPYWPWPPDCFLYLYSTSDLPFMVSLYAIFGLASSTSTLYSFGSGGRRRAEELLSRSGKGASGVRDQGPHGRVEDSRSSEGEKRIFTWPYCPCPPDCFLYLYSTSEFFRIVSL